MKRSEIAKKFDDVVDKLPLNPRVGDRYAMSESMSIPNQIKQLKEGVNKIFWMEVKDISPELSIKLMVENVFVSPTQYV